MIRTLAAGCCAALALLAAPSAGSAATIGIGDQQASMFSSPLFQQLDVPIVRYIAPYDAMDHGDDARNAAAFIEAAQKAGARVLVAFYHSRHTPMKLPSRSQYIRATRKFIRAFPYVREYQPWNEANRGTVKGQFASPSARTAATYYMALRSICTGCTVTGLDLLDGVDMGPSLRYLRTFQKYAKPAPRIWGLHNYSDTNRNSMERTRAFLRAVRGSVWLTETGGVVKLGSTFPGGRTGQERAAKALRLMFRIADAFPRIKRLYIFQWTGSGPNARFDAGLTNPDGTARPGYRVVRDRIGS
ncbi:MAG: hypothetical protein IRZ32_08125 [Solirubrobacteraceae bacterium]|nr:hypothetical protein [Solirubrobacteraceae bacterium]